MVIGGAEDKRGERLVLSRLVELAGPDPHFVVISTASMRGEEAIARYSELFTEMGAARVTGVRPLTRVEAADPAAAEPLVGADGIFLTGGNQVRLVSVIGGTRLEDALFSARDRGVIIAGTSAGASAVAAHMVAFGRPGASPRHRMVHISAGLGLIEDLIVDQHFEQRGRMGRLLAAVALSPQLLGLGLDEDTAAIVYADRTLEVVGKGSVTIVDGSHISTDSFQVKGHRPMMVSGAVVHALPAGYWFDLRTRNLLPPEVVEEKEASE